MFDIYFKLNYGKLYEKMENGIVEVFEYESKLGTIRNMFIKRKIETKVDQVTYYDITTPYGYGGPIITSCINEESKSLLVEEYNKAFGDYCKENNIVSEFIRFHPILENHNDFKSVYNVEYMRKTLGTNLKDYDDPFQKEFSKSGRKTTRRALRDGVTYEIEENPENIDEFMEIYYSTMDRNNADDYYYFEEEYFKNILENLKGNVVIAKAIYEGKTISSGLYFVYDKTIHTHLSGTLKGYLNLSPAYVLKYGTVLWGKENGFELIHYGGGTSNSKDDSLYRFKKRFAKNTEFDFYIGKKIWNENIYKEFCDLNEVNEELDYFPAYRAE